jgi:pyrimidine operon attenuation protein / uracil phosphoribosyltransferase
LLAARGLRQNPNNLRTSLLVRVQTAYDAAFMAAQNIPVPVKLREKARLMTASEMEAELSRISQEIVTKNGGANGLELIGIRRRGVPMAERLGKLIERKQSVTIPVGSLGISFYREDLSTLGPKPVVEASEIEFPIEAKKIILVDDVLFTGRTTLAALEVLASLGPIIQMQLCVLIDRGHRELPIAADFIGRTVATTMNEVIEVKFMETDGMEKVLLMEKT